MEDGVPSVADNMLQSLQAQLKEKQASLVDLRAQAEQRMLQELEQKQQWQEERIQLRRRVDELQNLLEGERERGKGIEREKEMLEYRVAELMEKGSTSVSASCQIRGLIKYLITYSSSCIICVAVTV